MKKLIGTAALTVFVCIAAIGQPETSRFPALSKDVQKVQVRKNERHSTRIVTVNLPNSSKSVQMIPMDRARPVRIKEVTMGGFPAHVISKGVARMQFERARKK